MDVVEIHTIYMFDLFKIWIGIEMDDLFFDGSVFTKTNLEKFIHWGG